MNRRYPHSGTSLRFARHFLGIAALCSCALAAEPAEFAGSWKLDSAQSADPKAAIESIIAQVDSAEKPSVRERLREVSQPAKQLSIAMEKDKLRIAENGTEGFLAPVDGSVVDLAPSVGVPLKRRLNMEKGKLVEFYRAEDGSRTNRYQLADEGKTLFVDVNVIGDGMPAPVIFRLAYARQADSNKPQKR